MLFTLSLVTPLTHSLMEISTQASDGASFLCHVQCTAAHLNEISQLLINHPNDLPPRHVSELNQGGVSVHPHLHWDVKTSLTLFLKTSSKSLLRCSWSYRYSAFSRHLSTWDPNPCEPWGPETERGKHIIKSFIVLVNFSFFIFYMIRGDTVKWDEWQSECLCHEQCDHLVNLIICLLSFNFTTGWNVKPLARRQLQTVMRRCYTHCEGVALIRLRISPLLTPPSNFFLCLTILQMYFCIICNLSWPPT